MYNTLPSTWNLGFPGLDHSTLKGTLVSASMATGICGRELREELLKQKLMLNGESWLQLEGVQWGIDPSPHSLGRLISESSSPLGGHLEI